MTIYPTAIALSLLLAAAPASAEPALTEVEGVVQVQTVSDRSWVTVAQPPQPVPPGAKVRTGSHARAAVTFDDGSKIELGPDTSFVMENAGETTASMKVELGLLRAWVAKYVSQHFQVRTPTAVCSVRGTEFTVQVLSGGRTNVELFKGLLGVEDNHGNQTLLRPNERLTVDLRGMALPQARPTQTQLKRADFHGTARAEVGLAMTQEQVQAAAATEAKLAEYQQGKVLLDVNGRRVRLEEYVLRPSPNQFKLVVLDKRTDRFDYFYYLGTFNQALPTDLSVALRQLPGCLGAQCAYYLTDFQTGRSNLSDSLYEHGMNTLGGQIDVNHNADPLDDVRSLFDPVSGRFIDVTGRPVFQTLFNQYGFYVNGRLKYGWTGPGITSYNDKTLSATTDPITAAPLTAANAWLDPNTGQLATRTVNVTFPDAGKVHQRVYESYSDGTFIQWDNYIIDTGGRIAPIADFSGITSGTAFQTRLLDYNYEQAVTSSHFSGRRIDLVVEPRILVQSGLIQ